MTNNLTEILGDQSVFHTLKECNKDCYELFSSNIKKHFNKFPNTQVKDLLSRLIDNDLIKIGHPDKNKNLLLGQVVRTHDDRVAGVVINTITHDIDFDGNSLSFDKVINSIYYIVIEHSLKRNFKSEINKDKLLLQRVAHYFNYVLVKNLKLFELYKDKRSLFDFIVNYFFYVHIADYNPNLAYEQSISPGDEELIKSLLPIDKLNKYKQFNSLYDALYDFQIVSMTPNNMKYLLTNTIGIFSYINIHASLSSMIAAIIVSKYKHPNFASLFISTDMINAIEAIVISKYLNRISFDLEVLNRAFAKADDYLVTTSIKTVL